MCEPGGCLRPPSPKGPVSTGSKAISSYQPRYYGLRFLVIPRDEEHEAVPAEPVALRPQHFVVHRVERLHEARIRQVPGEQLGGLVLLHGRTTLIGLPSSASAMTGTSTAPTMPPGVVHHLAHGQKPDVWAAQHRGGRAKARHVHRREPRTLDEPGR